MIDAVPVAQWIEHQPSKLRVTGSSPVGRTSGSLHVFYGDCSSVG